MRGCVYVIMLEPGNYIGVERCTLQFFLCIPVHLVQGRFSAYCKYVLIQVKSVAAQRIYNWTRSRPDLMSRGPRTDTGVVATVSPTGVCEQHCNNNINATASPTLRLHGKKGSLYAYFYACSTVDLYIKIVHLHDLNSNQVSKPSRIHMQDCICWGTRRTCAESDTV